MTAENQTLSACGYAEKNSPHFVKTHTNSIL